MQDDLLLAVYGDGLYLAHVLQLALREEGLRREVAHLLRPGQYADVYALDVLLCRELRGVRYSLRLQSGIEGAQSVELHADTLCQQLGQTLAELRQHAVDASGVAHQSVLGHVLGQSSCVEQSLGVAATVVLSTFARVTRCVLSDHVRKFQIVFCHNCNNF